MTDEEVKTSVRMPASLKWRLKRHLVDRRQGNQNSFILEAINEKLERESAAKLDSTERQD